MCVCVCGGGDVRGLVEFKEFKEIKKINYLPSRNRAHLLVALELGGGIRQSIPVLLDGLEDHLGD